MPSCKTVLLSPLLRSINKGTGVLPGSLSRQLQNKKQFRTAQLHIQKPNLNKDKGEERTPEKKEGMLHLPSLRASLTVEAALVLPVFLAAMCILIFPLRVLEAQEAAQLEMEKAVEIAAVSEGVRASLKAGVTGERTDGKANGVSGQKGEGGSGSASSALFEAFDLAVTGSAILTAFDPEVFYSEKLPSFQFPTAEEPMVSVQVSGLIRFPFMRIMTDSTAIDQVLWKVKCPTVLVSSRRAWVGRKGGAGRSYGTPENGKTGDGQEDGEDRTVYIAENSSKSGRFHVSSGCHYLHNDLTVLTRAQLENSRNKSGGKYHPCPSCKPQNCETVYVFKSGSAYHSGPSCKAIGAYVTEMKESEARGRGLTPCSYCGRGH